MQLSVDFDFCAAHRLPYYDGPCKRMHGHNYKLQVVIEGKPDPRDGMIFDFDQMRTRVWEHALSKCDHQTLNDFMDNPTAEHVIVWMWEQLQPHIPGLKELRLWETPQYCVTYSP
ncbi:MAG: 6-carboxytetrahydropterin synthase QueD [Myxococcaceae bacterium]|nr:6-carboxytetrahydropterin synthase QueD [Myxococcaceae bacterium]MCI0671799.1 6-carboxytetrahydropterin synthase QueD [Myxococcaceae bacterium]